MELKLATIGSENGPLTITLVDRVLVARAHDGTVVEVPGQPRNGYEDGNPGVLTAISHICTRYKGPEWGLNMLVDWRDYAHHWTVSDGGRAPEVFDDAINGRDACRKYIEGGRYAWGFAMAIAWQTGIDDEGNEQQVNVESHAIEVHPGTGALPLQRARQGRR